VHVPGTSQDQAFDQVHTQPSIPASQPLGNRPLDPSTIAPSNVSHIKADLSTSDTPPPSSYPHTLEPRVIHEIQNAAAAPHGDVDLLPDEASVPPVHETLGYLKGVCGLDYGWGPTAIQEWMIEHIHILSGLDWATSICVSALIVRLVAFGFGLNAANTTVRLRELTPHLRPLQTEYKQATANRDQARMTQIAAQMRQMKIDFDVKYSRIFLPLIIQIPFQFGAFRLYRGMCELPVPGLVTSDWLWMTDLTQGDPLMVLPFLSAAILYTNVKLGSDVGGDPAIGKAQVILGKVIPLASFIFMYLQPGGVQIYFITASALGLIQTMLMRTARFRSLVGVLPLPPKATSSSAGPGGLNISPPRAPSPPPFSNVSLIDKFVDSAKSRRDKFLGGFKESKEALWGQKEEKLRSRRMQELTQKAEAYEARRRRELTLERENRNHRNRSRMAGEGGAGGGGVRAGGAAAAAAAAGPGPRAGGNAHRRPVQRPR
jgi:YidC/Oxa1 family membrane protein insertase